MRGEREKRRKRREEVTISKDASVVSIEGALNELTDLNKHIVLVRRRREHL